MNPLSKISWSLAAIVVAVFVLLQSCNQPTATPIAGVTQYPASGNQGNGWKVTEDALLSIGIESDPDIYGMATTDAATTINTRWIVSEMTNKVITSPSKVMLHLKLDDADFKISVTPGGSAVIPNHATFEVVGIEMIGWKCNPRDELKQMWDCTQQ